MPLVPPLITATLPSSASIRLSILSLPDQRPTPGRRWGLKNKSIGPIETEMADLFCSDPVRERTALDTMRHYALLRIDLERPPVTEVGPPSLSCFFSASLEGIIAGEPCGAAYRYLCRHVTVGLIEDQTRRRVSEWSHHLTGSQNMFAGN